MCVHDLVRVIVNWLGVCVDVFSVGVDIHVSRTYPYATMVYMCVRVSCDAYVYA